jgi:hypothetical protein
MGKAVGEGCWYKFHDETLILWHDGRGPDTWNRERLPLRDKKQIERQYRVSAVYIVRFWKFDGMMIRWIELWNAIFVPGWAMNLIYQLIFQNYNRLPKLTDNQRFPDTDIQIYTDIHIYTDICMYNVNTFVHICVHSFRRCYTRVWPTRSRFSVVFLGPRTNVEFVRKFHVALRASHAALPMAILKISP